MKVDQHAWTRLLPTRVVLWIAELGPIGSRLPAPGTWGSAAGLLYFAVFFQSLDPLGNLVASAIGGWIAVGICAEAERRLGMRDPGRVILDEFVAMPLCFLGWYRLVAALPRWEVLVGGFLLFRFFDIAKPLGIRRLQDLPGGWGVVIDDTAAALATCAVMHMACWIL